MNTKRWRRDDILQAEIASLTYEGKAVARCNGMVIFVRGALPGDLVDVRLTKVKASYVEGETVAIHQASSWRVPARCRHFGACGGCASQDLDYRQQTTYKAQQVRDSLKHIGGLDLDVRPARAMREPWRYRNKMEFAFGESDGRVYLGLMQRGSFMDVVETVECHLCTPRVLAALRLVESFAQRHALAAYRPRRRTGVLRNLVVREGLRTGDLMINLISTSAAAPSHDLVAALGDISPTTVLWSHNDSAASVARADAVHLLYGSGEISERIAHLMLSVGPFSFLQTNSEMVEALYDEIARQAALTGGETILDLYCGVGAIGLYLARQARRVVGIDAVGQAIDYARRNAAANGIANASFECAEVEALSTLTFGAIAPDIVILDPPRAGLHPRLVATLRQLGSNRLIYVSCNPAALARDLRALADMYDIGYVQPVDMFPHTWHIESVVTLTKKESTG